MREMSRSKGTPPSRGTRVVLPYLILMLGFCFTLLVFHYFSKLTRDQDLIRFQRSAQEIQDQIRLRIETSITLLRAGTGLFAASHTVDAGEFERFVEQIELEKNYPGVQGIGFARRFSREKLADVIAAKRHEGVEGFRVWPEDPPRDEYTAIVYLQPEEGLNTDAIGYDMFTEPVRRQAMETARDTGRPSASGRVTLIQERKVENKQGGFLIYVPVYQKGVPLATVAERRAALLGYVYSPYRIDDFLKPVTAEKTRDVAFQVYDGTEIKRENLLSAGTNEAANEPLFSDAKALDVAGHTWILTYATRASFEQGSGQPLLKYTAIIGILLSFLFAAVTRAEIRARARAERATDEVKESESTIRQTLTEREHAEEALGQASKALNEANERALLEYERMLERIKGLAQTLGTARELTAVFRGLREFTDVSVPCNGFFVSLYDRIADVRTACYGWGDNEEVDVSELPPMSVTAGGGPNSQAVLTGQVVITDDYMRATEGHPSVIVGPDNGLRPKSSIAIPMAVMGRIIGTIEVQSYQPASYRHEHATAMTMAANLTAVAIQNVRLLKREKSAREAAEESNRLKDEFLATVSHEVRTPLTAILGWARLLESGGLDEQASRQAIETIWRNAKSQAQIIDDILDVSRIITGHLSLDLHPLEVVPVIEAAIGVIRPTAEAKNITIATQLDQRPLVVSGDANRLQQVVWNLLSNAVKFTDAGGRVVLSVRQVDSGVEIRVTDTGQGIKRDFLPFVFDRFRQADSTTTRQHGGLGLGLAIARHLVEIHGGSIKAESDGEGRGASFSVRLPLVDSTVKVTDDETRNGDSLTPVETLEGLQVLVVDDDADTLRLLTTALRRQHAKVTSVASAGEALKAVKANKPDVLISDIAMPDEDGYGLIRKIRALDKELQSIPAVAITAYAKEEDRNRALSSGFQAYLAKPVELKELVSVVAKAARREF